ncbi:hypothetical protein [Collimonas sp. OK242]|nr:hypothetical protein [Collimonas sp. OK242]
MFKDIIIVRRWIFKKMQILGVVGFDSAGAGFFGFFAEKKVIPISG